MQRIYLRDPFGYDLHVTAFHIVVSTIHVDFKVIYILSFCQCQQQYVYK